MSNFNRFKSSSIFGTFQNSDTPDNSILANGIFDRNLTIKNNLNIGLETGTPVLDVSGNVINTIYESTGGNINFDFNGISYSIGKAQLIKLLNNLATESFVDNAVQNAIQSLINNSPASLDTLFELSQSLGNDPNFATTVSTNLGLKANINNPTFTGSITTPNIITSGMTLNGNFITNSTTLTPIEISRLTGITDNIQTQLNNRGILNGTNTWTGNNLFNYLRLSGTNYLFTNSTTLSSTMTGSNNIVMGSNAGLSTTTGGTGVYIGNGAGQLLNSSNSVFIGFQTGRGVDPLNQNWDNVGIGRQVMNVITSAKTNSGVGHFCLRDLTTGGSNCGIGANTLRTLTTGSFNCAIGNNAGLNATTNSSNTFLGNSSDIDVSGNNWNFSTAIGRNSLITASNQIVMGGLNGSILPTVFIPSGSLTIGGTYRTGLYNVDVSGNINTTNYFLNGININTIFQPITNMTNYYLKSEIDNTFLNYYTKSEVDNISFNNNNSLTNYYNKTETDNFLNLKANINNPTFTGTVGGITKNMIGLSNVDNTTDLNKPISSATQTALNLKANINSPTFTGFTIFPSVGITTNINIQSTANINLLGNIFCQTQNTTISPLELSYLDNTNSNIQTQINNTNTNINNINNQLLNIYTKAETETIFLNETDAINDYGRLEFPNNWINRNNFNRIVVNSNNATSTTGRGDLEPSQQGFNIQWNRTTVGNGQTYLMNHKGGASGNGGFIFQRYNGSGFYFDEPLVIGDTIQMNNNLIMNGTTTITANNLTATNLTATNNLTTTNLTATNTVTANTITATNNLNVTNLITTNNLTSTTQITSSTITANTQVNTNVLNPISGGRITSNSPIINPNTYTGAYFVDSALGGFLLDKTFPIFCSIRDLGKRDDVFVVMPGYRLDLFENTNYTTFLATITNIGGSSPAVFASTSLYSGNTGRIGSCRLYFNTTEIILPIFS